MNTFGTLNTHFHLMTTEPLLYTDVDDHNTLNNNSNISICRLFSSGFNQCLNFPCRLYYALCYLRFSIEE